MEWAEGKVVERHTLLSLAQETWGPGSLCRTVPWDGDEHTISVPP